jgi:hypothetical protein
MEETIGIKKKCKGIPQMEQEELSEELSKPSHGRIMEQDSLDKTQ